MSISSLHLKTPVGDLQVSVDLLAGFQPEPSLEVFAFDPVLPQGMSVAACFAVVLHLPGGEADAQVRLIATLLPVVSVEGGAETGQGLEAQSWRGEKHLVVVGTEDAEFLEARLPNQIRLANDSFTYEPHSFSLNFTRARGAIPVEVHFMVAWNELPEPQECSCWYAVDQAHASVVGALRAIRSLNWTLNGAAPSGIISFLPCGTSPLRAG